MCFDDEAGPPIPPMAGGSVATERLHLTSGDGTRFAAFAANASATPSESAMLVLPDVRGLHRYYEELAMRFAEAGIDALAIDYFGRTATTDDRSDDFRFMDHVSRTAYPTMAADIEAGSGPPARGRPAPALHDRVLLRRPARAVDADDAWHRRLRRGRLLRPARRE